MDKCINFCEFMRYLVDDEKLAEQGSKIIVALVAARAFASLIYGNVRSFV